MYQSILQFIEKDIREIEKIVGDLLTGEKDAVDLSREVVDRTMTMANRLICELYEKLDEEIRESVVRKLHWRIERRSEPKELLDIAGTLRFNRTGYEDKRTGKYIYLLDEILGLESHQRLTLGAAARILEEALLTSYEKGGKAASPMDAASKQTVKELVHGALIDFPQPEPEKKKKVRYLHIVADEDHVSAQFWKGKGDLKEDALGNKGNTIMAKVIVVYEDIINESGEKSKNPRYRLTGKKIFSGVYNGTEANLGFWEEVRDYIGKNYDMDELERIYIAGDGAAWIKAGTEVLEKSRFVLDRFHMMKYVNASVAHLKDSAEDVKSDIWESLNGAHKKELKEVYRKILEVTEEGNKYEEVKGALNYFLNQWEGIKIRREEAGGCWKCSAEGQVSHILSARMSSRPMGWSELGCHQMAQLRAYYKNGGKVIDLVRYQKEQKKRQKQEERRKEREELIKELRRRQSGWKYADELHAEIPGLGQHSMKWLRNMIDRALGA